MLPRPPSASLIDVVLLYELSQYQLYELYIKV